MYASRYGIDTAFTRLNPHLAPAPLCRCEENQRPCPGELSKLARSRLAIAEMSSPSRRSSCAFMPNQQLQFVGIRAGAGLVSP